MIFDDFDLLFNFRLLKKQNVKRTSKKVRHDEQDSRLYKQYERWLKQKNQRKQQQTRKIVAFACRRCSTKFINNTKFHEHVRNHHAKKLKSTSIANFTFFNIFVVLFAITFKTITTSKFSRLLIQVTKATQIACSFISTSTSCVSFIFSQTSSLQHRFVVRSQSMQQHQTKLYLIIDDFYVMFDEKYFKKSVNIIQKLVSSSLFSSSRQTRIIAYFKLVASTIKIVTFSINQDSTISKISLRLKRSKSRILICSKLSKTKRI